MKIQKNSLVVTHPDLMKEWDYTKNKGIDPTTLTHGSNIKVWWKCLKCGHEWQARIYHRARGSGCPKEAMISQESFQEYAVHYFLAKHTEVIHSYKTGKMKMDCFLPHYNIAIEYDGSFFHKNKQKDLTKNKHCRDKNITLYRLREEPLVSLNDSSIDIMCQQNDDSLSNAISILIKILFNQEEKIDISKHRIEIENLREHHWKENSLLEKNPEIAAEWHPTKNGSLRPEYVSYKSNKIALWRCKHGHEWSAKISSRTNGNGCPYCSGLYPIIGKTDLATTHPKLAKEWHPTKNGNLKPTDVLAGCHKKVWWFGECGHEWEARIDSRARGSNCPICSNKKVLVGFNDLATTHPHLAKEWHPTKNDDLKPTDVTAGSDKKVWWINEQRGEWQAKIYNRSKIHLYL